MKKILLIITSFIICGAVILFSCTKKDEAVVPATAKTNTIHVGNLRISVDDENISLSSAKVEDVTNPTSITILRRDPLTINKISVGPSGNTVITRIAITPSDQMAIQSGGGGCPSIVDIRNLVTNIDNAGGSYQTSATDICKFLSFLKCLIQNPEQYGLSTSDIDNFSLSTNELNLLCQYLSCSACSSLITNSSGSNSSFSSSSASSSSSSSGTSGSFKFNGTTYQGSFGSCNSSSSSTYTLYTSDYDFITANISSSTKSVTVYVGGDYYSTSSSTQPTITVNGNTVTIYATVKKSGSTSSYDVTATINCN